MESTLAKPEFFTPARCRMILCALLLIDFIARCLYFNINCPISLSGDEAHYWDWSRQLDWSYYSKGPVVAFLIRAGCALFGDNMFGVRFPALVLAVANSLTIYWLTLLVTKIHKIALGAVVLCHFIPMFVAGSMLMTIDPPYFLGWGLAMCFIYKAIFHDQKWAWPVAGAFVGLAFLAKYAALLWLVSMLLFLLASPKHRRYLKTIWPLVTIVVSLLFTIPVIIWNAKHDWVTFGHVARSTTENQAHFNPLEILSNLGSLFGSQIGILNPVIAIIMLAAVIVSVRHRHHTFLLAFSLPFFMFVTAVAFFKSVEPNWPAATYCALVPLTAWFIWKYWPKTKNITIVAGIVGMMLIPLVHYTTWLYPIMPVEPRRWDPSFRLHEGADIAAVVEEQLAELSPGAFLLAEKYQSAALMAFYLPDHPKTYYYGSYIADPEKRNRLTQYDMWPDRSLDQPGLIGKDAVYVGFIMPDLVAAFDRVEPLPDTPIIRNGVTIRKERIARCYGFKGLTKPDDGLTKR